MFLEASIMCRRSEWKGKTSEGREYLTEALGPVWASPDTLDGTPGVRGPALLYLTLSLIPVLLLCPQRWSAACKENLLLSYTPSCMFTKRAHVLLNLRSPDLLISPTCHRGVTHWMKVSVLTLQRSPCLLSCFGLPGRCTGHSSTMFIKVKGSNGFQAMSYWRGSAPASRAMEGQLRLCPFIHTVSRRMEKCTFM